MRARAPRPVRPTRPGTVVHAVRELSPAARLLVLNQVGINLGFYMVLPFLAGYLTDDLGLAAATVGLVLGARTLSQQGLFLPSGALVDRLGPWPFIVAGCGLRVVAFGLLALADDPAPVIAGVLLIGVAGALFNPAVRKYLALESGDRRAEAFAVFEVAGNTGALLGPLLGAALLAVDFRTACLVAAVVFAVLTVAQVAVLPRAHATTDPAPVLAGVRTVLTDRRLGLLVLAASAYLALFNQLYLALPVEAERVTGQPEAIAGVFLVSSALTIALQLRVTAWCRRRWSTAGAVSVGLLVLATAFVPLLLTTAHVPTGAGLSWAVLPMLLTTALFSLGVAMVTPLVVVLVGEVAGDGLLATAYGWYYLVAAVATTVVATGAGALLDTGGAAGRVASFALLTGVGLAGALGVRAVDRRPVTS